MRCSIRRITIGKIDGVFPGAEAPQQCGELTGLPRPSVGWPTIELIGLSLPVKAVPAIDVNEP